MRKDRCCGPAEVEWNDSLEGGPSHAAFLRLSRDLSFCCAMCAGGGKGSVEVEAVKFLKEEPQRLDGLLKRCRGVTDTLAQIRRSFYP